MISTPARLSEASTQKNSKQRSQSTFAGNASSLTVPPKIQAFEFEESTVTFPIPASESTSRLVVSHPSDGTGHIERINISEENRCPELKVLGGWRLGAILFWQVVHTWSLPNMFLMYVASPLGFS